MATLIANLGHDENWQYMGGIPGDQTGNEWEVREWYACPWNVVLRYPDRKLANDMALLAQHAAENDKVGYSQGWQNDSGRISFYYQLLDTPHFDPAEIDIPCNSDCSAGVTAITIAAGLRNNNYTVAAIDPTSYTGNMVYNFTNAGFEALYDSKYVDSCDFLLPGDILLREDLHTTINLTAGEFAGIEDFSDILGGTDMANSVGGFECIIHPNENSGEGYDNVTQYYYDGRNLHAFADENELTAIKGLAWVCNKEIPTVRMDYWQLQLIDKLINRGSGIE